MDKSEKISRNLNNLRKTYNLSQEDIGKVLNVTGGAVSTYERNRRGISVDAVSRLSTYFMMTEEELNECDIPRVRRLPVSAEYFFANIDVMFPVTTGNLAEANIYFKQAMEDHLDVMEDVSRRKFRRLDKTPRIIEKYAIAYEDLKSRAETAANMTSLIFMMGFVSDMVTYMIEVKPANFTRFLSDRDKRFIEEGGASAYVSRMDRMCERFNRSSQNISATKCINEVYNSRIYGLGE